MDKKVEKNELLLGYIAPEILNENEYDCKVDIFSLGIIFHTM